MANNHFIVGLGGTGGKVIRELRKAIEANRDEKGKKVSTAHFEYAYLDTSDNILTETDNWMVLGRDVSLARAQIGIYGASSVLPVLHDPLSFPGMKDWIEPRKAFSFIDAGTAGAAQRRKLGRLVFAQNSPAIVGLLNDRLNQLETETKSAQATIHVVCGLAGGTGSGFIADTVAQLRAMRPNDSTHRILIYALLPDQGSPWAKDVSGHSSYYANGYAALVELNAMGARVYNPVNVRDGTRHAAAKYFNGCYLVNNINENNVRFDVQNDVPAIIAEFLYQKTLTNSWDDLNRAEKGENDTQFIEMDDGQAARAKLFMAFGIKRVVVPEQEIKEYMAYSLSVQVVHQLIYNNFRVNEGFVAEPVQHDWGAEAGKPDVKQRLCISDAHLTLDIGILEQDTKLDWRPIRAYWESVATKCEEAIKTNKTIEKATWIADLYSRMNRVYDETYRLMGGVKKFYAVKDNARVEMAAHIGSLIEKDFFERWSVGELSLKQLVLFSNALVAHLTDKKKEFEERVQASPGLEERISDEINTLTGKFNNFGFLSKVLTDSRETCFTDIRQRMQVLYAQRTLKEAYIFAARLLPLVIEEVVALRGRLDQLVRVFDGVGEKVLAEKDSRLKNQGDTVYQSSIFERSEVEAINTAIRIDEQGQTSRTQRIRRHIIALGGTQANRFQDLIKPLTVGNVFRLLSQDAAELTEQVHADLAQRMTPVLHVNIVERLARQYSHNPSGMKGMVGQLYREAGSMLKFDVSEINRTVPGNAGARGRQQAVCVFLPECENSAEFREALRTSFIHEKNPGDTSVVLPGTLPNELVLIKVSSLMPVRYIDGLAYLKEHYDGLLKNPDQAVLMHSEAACLKLPPLYARSGAEVEALRYRKPYIVVARLLELIQERANPETGVGEWIMRPVVDGRIRIKVLKGGKQWLSVLEAAQDAEVQKLLEASVTSTLSSQYKHIDQQRALHDKYNALVNQRLEEVNYNEQDPLYMALDAAGAEVKKIIGLPDEA